MMAWIFMGVVIFLFVYALIKRNAIIKDKTAQYKKKILDQIKKNNDSLGKIRKERAKKIMEELLRLKLQTEENLEKVDQETLEKLKLTSIK